MRWLAAIAVFVAIPAFAEPEGWRAPEDATVYLYRGVPDADPLAPRQTKNIFGLPAEDGVRRLGDWWTTDPVMALRYTGHFGSLMIAKVSRKELQQWSHEKAPRDKRVSPHKADGSRGSSDSAPVFEFLGWDPPRAKLLSKTQLSGLKDAISELGRGPFAARKQRSAQLWKQGRSIKAPPPAKTAKRGLLRWFRR